MDIKKRNKQLKRIAHHLDPIIQLGDKGLTAGVINETSRALADHELIKVRLADPDRESRVATGDALTAAVEATLVQRIGKVIVLFKENPDANPKLSNLHRLGSGY